MAKIDWGVVRRDDDAAVLTTTATLTPLGYQQITVLTTSTALTVPSGATSALIQPEAQAVHWRDDGVAPTASIGMRLAALSTLTYNGDLAAFRVIQDVAGGILNVTYYK